MKPSLRSTTLREELKPFDIVCLMRERTPFPRALIEKLPNLKFVSLTGARSPSLDTQALKERGIPVSNTRSARRRAVHGRAHLGPDHRRGARPGEGRAQHARRARGTTGLLPGFSLGGKTPRPPRSRQHRRARRRRSARRSAWSASAWSQNLTPEKAQAAGVALVSKEELLSPNRDVVTIHLVLGDRTRGLVSGTDLAKNEAGRDAGQHLARADRRRDGPARRAEERKAATRRSMSTSASRCRPTIRCASWTT